MTPLAQLDNVHLKVRPGDHLSVLLGNPYHLRHVLHAANRLANLPSHSDKGLAAVRSLLALLVEVRSLAGISTLVPRLRIGQLHQVCYLTLIDLHHGAVEQTVAIA